RCGTSCARLNVFRPCWRGLQCASMIYRCVRANAVTSPRVRGEEALEPADDAGVDQQTVEAACLGAVATGVGRAVTSQHDILLLFEGRVERNTGGFESNERQIGAVDAVHHDR